jgi:lysophospholipase L1-like esterase
MTAGSVPAEPAPLSLATRAGELVLRHPLAITLVVLPLALVLGSIAGYAFGKAGSYRSERLRAVSAELRQIAGDYLLAAGDSHIERWPARALCGLPLVNAGVSGATATSYGDFLAELPLTRPPRAIILTIGTNDANEKRFRDGDEAARRFGQGFQPLLARLRRTAPLVMLTGVPRINPEDGEGFSPEAAERIDAIAQATCKATPGCLVTAAPGTDAAQVDGVHFKDYAAAYREVGPALCAALLREPTAGGR